MSDDSAPSVFPLSNSSEDELLDKNEIADKCPLCRSAKKYFFCSDCIRNGDFYSSRSVQRESSQRFGPLPPSEMLYFPSSTTLKLSCFLGLLKRKWLYSRLKGKFKSFWVFLKQLWRRKIELRQWWASHTFYLNLFMHLLMFIYLFKATQLKEN